MMLNVGGDIWWDSRLGNSVVLPSLSVPPLFGAFVAGAAWPLRRSQRSAQPKATWVHRRPAGPVRTQAQVVEKGAPVHAFTLALAARARRQRRCVAGGEVGDDHVAQHRAIVRTATPLAEVAVEDRFERVLVGDAEDAERADDHVQVEWIDAAANTPCGWPRSKNARNQVHRAVLMLAIRSSAQMFGAMDVLDATSRKKLGVGLVVVEGELGQVADGGIGARWSTSSFARHRQLGVGALQDGDVQPSLLPK